MQKITSQKIFDLAWQRFIVEKANPSISYGSCSYLDANDNRCAVGLSFSDDQICSILKAGLMRKPICRIVSAFPQWFDENDPNFHELSFIQADLHDNLVSFEMKTWKITYAEMVERYMLAARVYNLSIPS